MTFQTHLNPLSLKLVKLSTCFAEVWWKTATKLYKKHGKKLQLIADSKGWQMSLLAVLKHFWERNSKTPLDIPLEQKKNALNNVHESLEVLSISKSGSECSLLEADQISKSLHGWLKIPRLQKKSILFFLEIHFLISLAKTVTQKRWEQHWFHMIAIYTKLIVWWILIPFFAFIYYSPIRMVISIVNIMSFFYNLVQIYKLVKIHVNIWD